MTTVSPHLDWWNSLRHGGLLLDPTRLSALVADAPEPLSRFEQDRLRRHIDQFIDDPETHRNKFVAFVMEHGLAFHGLNGYWQRGPEVSRDWSRTAITGETVRPQQLWHGPHKSPVPVFIDDEKKLGLGRGKRVISHALQWLRQTDNRLAVITNGFEWRIVFAGLDYDAYCQWDIEQWFTEGGTSAEFNGLRSLLNRRLWTKPSADTPAPLLTAINDARKGQAELSQVLGERVRQAVELLIQGHGPVLSAHFETLDPAEIYRAGVRIIMRMVVVLFAESRDALLPRDNPIYHAAYSLAGLRDLLERMTDHRRRNSYAAWPRIVSLFHLVHSGSSHEALVVPTYGGQLFEPGNPDSEDGVSRALAVLENGCFDQDVMSDMLVYRILDLLSRTKIKIRQGRQTAWIPAPVDFSSLDNEYIGILYEGLLDFELRQATAENPIIFLAVGNQPALPLATLEAMEDRDLKNLLEKMQDTSSGGDQAGDDEAEGTEGEGDDTQTSAEPSGDDTSAESSEQTPDEAPPSTEEPAASVDVDDRHTIRSRAEAWAFRAIEAGKLVPKPAGKMTGDKSLRYQAALAAKARQIITKVVLPGEWYLVRWGGTRKGSGSYYTRPQLAIPTVHRTLRPLAYDPPSSSPRPRAGGEGQGEGAAAAPNPDDAPIEQWIPKRPEQILSLKVCDPSCGSGSFLLAALRFLTEALYASLHYHQRFQHFADRTVIDLIRDETTEQTLTDERLPCRPEDADFETRTKAVLRRYIVERCIYGVDLDPLAVELCRLSLWIETLDPRLPFTFLDHKIKSGNSLIGTWFDQFMHYPAMAWMREGGDKSHTNGVHFQKEAWTKAIKDRVPSVRHELMDYIDGGSLLNRVDLSSIKTVHDDAERALQAIHALGIHEAEQRAIMYRQLRSSVEFTRLKDSFDLWCAIWFWPPDQIAHCPLPLDFYEQQFTEEVQAISRQVAAAMRFFHWELEFPDVFRWPALGFDAVLGNPPWETLQPNSKEYFSGLDPLYRSYGNQDAKSHQINYFSNRTVESNWLRYNGFYKEVANWTKYSGSPFGANLKTSSADKQEHEFPIGDRGRRSFATSEQRHARWRQKREESTGYADSDHVFRHQGGGKPYTYKMFLELAYAILRDSGRLGLIVPSGIYSDFGAIELRELFIQHCSWEWLFGFENRLGIFDIHRSFKFNPLIIQKGGQTGVIRSAFMRRNLEDWEDAEQFATEYPRARVLQFSPRSKAILEIQSRRDLEVLERIYSNSVLLGDDSPDGWGIKYAQGDFNMTSDSKLFPPRTWWEAQGYRPDEYSRWIKGHWQPRTPTSPAPLGCKRTEIPPGILLSRDGESWISEDEVDTDTFSGKGGEQRTGRSVAYPLYQGVMINQLDVNFKQHSLGSGANAQWTRVPHNLKSVITPQYLTAECFYTPSFTQPRIAYRRIARTTDTRTWIGTPQYQLPSGDSIFILNPTDPWESIFASAFLSSFWFDWVVRRRLGGTNLSWYMMAENVCGTSNSARDLIELNVLGILGYSRQLSPWWIAFRAKNEALAARLSPLQQMAMTEHDVLRKTVCLQAAAARAFGLTFDICKQVLLDCDKPESQLLRQADLDPRGFWRIERSLPPEQRQTILTLVALHDLERSEANSGKDEVRSFLSHHPAEGWQIPETLRLADYGLGHDARALEHQPVRSHFGPRFYDWQLEQTPEDSWQECHLHARNLLGPTAYQTLLDELHGKSPFATVVSYQKNIAKPLVEQKELF